MYTNSTKKVGTDMNNNSTNQKDYFDLTTAIMVDTYLTVKFGLKHVHYSVPKIRNNGTARTYGCLYHHFTKRDDFKFAIGYVRGEDSEYWTGQVRYFYFDKNTPPYLVQHVLKSPLYLKKSSY